MKLRVIDVTPIGEKLIASYLILIGDTGILVDVGPRSTWERVYSIVEGEGVDLRYIFLTHIHLDHAGATGSLVERYPDVKVLVHPRGARHIANPEKLWNASKSVLGEVADIYGKPIPVPESNIIPVPDGYTIEVSGEEVKFIHTPGHASHHMSIYLTRRGLMFIGDSAGINIVYEGESVSLPTTPPPFKPDYYISSVDRMIRESPVEVAPGHYGSISDGREYLEMHLDEVKRWMDAVCGRMERK